MKTVNQNLKKAAAWATYGFAAITLFACNSYKGITDEEDGIYGDSYMVEQNSAVDGKNNYYQQYFSTKAAQIEEIPEEDLVFTDIEAYSSQESIDDEGYVVVEEDYIDDYGSWGSNTSEVTLNVYGGWNNGFYGNGWNAGYWYGGWNAGYWGGFRPWGFNYWNNPFWGYSSYWGYNPYWGWGNGYYNPWFNNGYGWGFGGYYNPWYYNNNGYTTIANRGRSNQDRFVSRGRSDRSNRGTREQSSLRGRSNTRPAATYASNTRPTSKPNSSNQAVRPSNNARPAAQSTAPSSAAKNFKIKRRSRPSNTAANTRPTNNSGTKKTFKSQNSTQRSFNRPTFQNSRPMSTPRNYSRPSSGRSYGGRGGRG